MGFGCISISYKHHSCRCDIGSKRDRDWHWTPSLFSASFAAGPTVTTAAGFITSQWRLSWQQEIESWILHENSQYPKYSQFWYRPQFHLMHNVIHWYFITATSHRRHGVSNRQHLDFFQHVIKWTHAFVHEHPYLRTLCTNIMYVCTFCKLRLELLAGILQMMTQESGILKTLQHGINQKYVNTCHNCRFCNTGEIMITYSYELCTSYMLHSNLGIAQ